jgi:uncharacterized protein YegL
MKPCHRCGKWRDPNKACIHCAAGLPSDIDAPATGEIVLPARDSSTKLSDSLLGTSGEFEELEEELRGVPIEVSPPPLPPRVQLPGEEQVPADRATPAHKLSREEALSRWDAVLDHSPVFADPTKPRPATPPPQPHFLVPFDFDTQDVITTSPISAATGCDASAALDIAMDARFDVASAPRDSDPAVDLLVTMTPLGPPLLDPRAGPVAHLVLALDLSASMNAPDKYPLLTRALAGMLEDLHKDSAAPVLLSVVAFAFGAETLLTQVSSKELAARRLLDSLDASPLRFGRYTDVVGALNRAGVIARESVRRHKAMPVRICLLTDGRPQDVVNARAVMEKIHKMPVDVDGLAFGDDADIGCLTNLIAGGRGGTVKHVRPDTIEDAFGRMGEVAQRVVAPRALLELELKDGVVGGMAYRFRPARHRYGDDAFHEGRRFRRDLGTMESGRTYSLLFQVRLPATDSAETEVGRVTLRVPGYGGPRTFEKMISIARHAGAPETSRDPEVAAARDVLDSLDNDDPQATLRALRMRRHLYEREQRDPHVLNVLDRAITELERHGTLAALSAADHAALISHTLTKRGGNRSRKPPARTGSPA